MGNVYYTAILERGEENYGVFFPDLPGCIAVGDTQEEALQNADEILAIYIDDLVERKQAFPKPTLPSNIEKDEDVDEVARVLFKATVPDKKQRINIILDESLIAAIDKVTSNRSAYISNAVREALVS